MTKRDPTLPRRMREPRKHAGYSSMRPALGVSAGASEQASTPENLTLDVSLDVSRSIAGLADPVGPDARGGVPTAPPRGGEIGGRGPEVYCPPSTFPPPISRLTPTVTQSVQFPMRTERGQNAREHWRDRARRVKDEKWSTAWSLVSVFGPRNPWPLPLIVTLTRGAPSGGLDDDNLVGSLKTVRDAVADWLGVDDKRSDLVRYRYAQERAKREWFVRIEFQPMPTAATKEQP